MPARVNKIFHDEDTRKRIKVGNIINRLEKCLNGLIELSPVQIKAADILLRKVLPDLTSVEHSGEIVTPYVARIPAKATDTSEWQEQNAPTSH